MTVRRRRFFLFLAVPFALLLAFFLVIGVPPLPGRPDDRGRAEVAAGPAYERAFKVPTLRNVALTAPYMEIPGNDSFGIAVVGLGAAFPGAKSFDVGAVPEGTWIHDNRLEGNGRTPAPAVKALGAVNADLLWDGRGWDNAWREPGARAFPPWLPERTWPVFLRRAWSRTFSLLRDLAGQRL